MIRVHVDPDLRPHVVTTGRIATGGNCPVCGEPIGYDGAISLVFVGRTPADRGSRNGAAVAVHAACTGLDEEHTVGNHEGHGQPV